MTSVLLIDHMDSFVYNLKDELEMQGAHVAVYRSTWETSAAMAYIAREKPDAIVLSPGPGAPREARLYHDLLTHAPHDLPMLGVCLGHQAMIEHCGGVVRKTTVMHGRASVLVHNHQGLFTGLPNPMLIGRYHSLVGECIPDVLIVDAISEEKVMAVRHHERPWYGVQFHPESVLTPEGPRLIAAFLAKVRAR